MLHFAGAFADLFSRPPTAQVMVDRELSSPIYTYTFLIVHLIALGLLIPRANDVLAVLKRNLWIVGVIVLALTSCLWSLEPEISLRRSFALVGSFALVLALAFGTSPRDYLKALLCVALVFIISTPTIVVLLPTYGKGTGVYAEAWRGITPHKNNLGWVLAISVIVLIYAARLRLTSGRVLLLALPLALICLWMTRSATSYLALLAALCVMGALGVMKRLPEHRAGLSMVLICVLIAAALLADQLTHHLLLALDKNPTLTGRTVIWDRLFQAISERPLIGHGYRAFWESDYAVDLMTISGFFASHSHNGYLDMLLDLGAVGLAVFLAACLEAAARLARSAMRGNLLAEAHLVLMTTCLFIGFSGQVVLRPNTIYFVLISLPVIYASGLSRSRSAGSGFRARPTSFPDLGGGQRARMARSGD